MKEQHFVIRKEETLAWVVVNRPDKRNAFKVSMWTDLADIMARLGEDLEVRVIVITGAGETSFASGADISEMREKLHPGENGYTVDAVSPALRVVEAVEKVVIAMINGYALGGGCELAMACDLRVASEGARIGIPAAKIGICVSPDNTQRLLDLVGPSRARDILFTGRLLTAGEALSIGLVDYVVPGQELEPFTADLAKRISGNAPLSVLGAKKTIRMLSRNRNLEEIADPLFISRKCRLSNDFKEGVNAFLDKRKPEFKGE